MNAHTRPLSADVLIAARQRRRRNVGVLYVDLEGQYAATIDHVREMAAFAEREFSQAWEPLE